MTGEPTGPLDGVRVLCVDNYLAGNYGPMLLALHGADVVKVESAGGEAMRASRPFVDADDGSWSHFELRMMRGKDSVQLDLNDNGEERVLFERLVGAADVFWTNLRPESARRRRVDPQTLQACNERLVYVSLTGFGLPENGVGEFATMPAFDILIQALSGLLARNADEKGTPVYNGLPLADQVASAFGALGVLLGLRQRDLTGHGCVVDVPMFDSMLALNEKAISMFGLSGSVPPPRMSATTAPFGMFPTADGWVCIAVGSDAVWRRFCAAIETDIGRPGLADDESLRTGTQRVRRLDEVTAVVEDYTRSRTSAEVVEHLLDHDVPAGQPLEVDELLTSRHVRDRGMVRDLPLTTGSSFPAVMSPIAISGARQPLTSPMRRDGGRSRVLRDWLGSSSKS